MRPKEDAPIQLLQFQTTLGGTKVTTSIPYDNVAHRFWRFRHDAIVPELLFETSPDAAVWTIRRRTAISSKGVSALASELTAGTRKPVANPGQAVFDDFAVSQPTVVGLESDSYRVGERDGSVEIVVTRTGNLESRSAADFVTQDGTAAGNSDFITTIGRVSFEAGETTKSFTIPITKDQELEDDETFSVVLRAVSGGAPGQIRQSVVTIVNDASASNAINGVEFFVRKQYEDFLNREADDAGLRFWTNNIRSCGSDARCIEAKRVDTSAAFFLSIEFQETGYLVYRLYQESFGRRPTFLEFMPDTRKISDGVIIGQEGAEARLAANRDAFIREFMSRAAFRERYDRLESDDYVDALYANAGIRPSREERTALVVGLLTKRLTRQQVLEQILGDERFIRGEFNRAFVQMQYFGYLRRDPDEAGYNFWLSKLNEFGGDFRAAEMVKAFIVSGEYRRRFGPE